MSATTRRTLISAMQVTLDGHILGPDGEMDWVGSWADGLGLLPGDVDAFVLGGGMYPGYERSWSSILADPDGEPEVLGRRPLEREVAYARRAARTPHLVVSTTLRDVAWPTARVVPDLREVAALRQEAGGAVYVVGGPGLLASLLDAGLLDELRLIVHPVATGGGTPLFGPGRPRRAFGLAGAEPLAGGRLAVTYRPAGGAPHRRSVVDGDVPPTA